MKICLYTSTAAPKRGGQEAVVDELASQFVRRGHQVVVLAPQPRRPLKPDDRGYPYRVVRHPRFYSTRWVVDWYRWFLLRLFHRERFDVIHCHGIHPPGYIAASCRENMSIPIVMTYHGYELEESSPRLARAHVRRRCEVALAGADGLVAISEMVEESYRRVWPGASLIERIPNGVDLAAGAALQSRPAGLDRGVVSGKYLLFLGRLKHQKGVDCLIRALALIADSQAPQLVIAGQGDEQASLAALVRELKLEDKVSFVGWVDGAVKAYLLQNAICTVIPSRRPETFGLVVVESYAAGRPVIVSAVAGLKELVVENETGMLVEPESVSGWAEAIRQLFNPARRAEQMGTKAKLRAQRYCWDRVAERHVELYSALVNSRAASKSV
jgi:glycosyltransferase involved in cell wall biosynthesis